MTYRLQLSPAEAVEESLSLEPGPLSEAENAVVAAAIEESTSRPASTGTGARGPPGGCVGSIR